MQTVLYVSMWFYYSYSPQFSNMRRMLESSFPVSRASAVVLNFNTALIFLPVCKKLLSFLQSSRKLRDLLPFHKSIDAHRYIGISIAFFTLVHIGGHSFNVTNVSNYWPFFIRSSPLYSSKTMIQNLLHMFSSLLQFLV